MKNQTNRLLRALEYELAKLGMGQKPTVVQAKVALRLTKKALKLLNHMLQANIFKGQDEEVLFFKETKPKFYSKYIYQVSIYNYLIKFPPGDEEAVHTFIAAHLANIQRFFDNNRAFYQYYRSGSTQMDQVYYTRGGFNFQTEPEDFEEDDQYSTSYDYKLSKLMANEQFRDFLQLELAGTGSEPCGSIGKVFPFDHPRWTASQTDAVELLYALKSGFAVNNGNIDIAELVAIWEFVFQMEIHEGYHKLLDISKRKKEMFIFLRRLTDSLWSFISEKFR